MRIRCARTSEPEDSNRQLQAWSIQIGHNDRTRDDHGQASCELLPAMLSSTEALCETQMNRLQLRSNTCCRRRMLETA
jgi:hypothetical protein